MRPISLRRRKTRENFGSKILGCSRRSLLSGGAATLLTEIALEPKRAFAATRVDVTSAPFNANPNSGQDSSSAFQAALNFLSEAGGGALIIPGGTYYFSNPLTYSGRSLTILGDGQEVSICVIRHLGTGLTVKLADSTCCLTVRDIGITPMPGTARWTAGGIACIVAGAKGKWQNCLIEDCDFGVPFGNFGEQYSSFYQALVLNNTTRARISNCNGHGNLLPGGIFLELQDGCNGTRVDGCSIDGYAWGLVVSAYSVGLHLNDTVFIGGTAVQTGAQPFNGPVNLLGFYITGCEFNCNNTVLILNQVTDGWISDTDLDGPQGGGSAIACMLQGCHQLTMHNLLFNGGFNGATNQIGVYATSSTNSPTGQCRLDSCRFENTGTAVVFDKGTQEFFCTDIAMYQSGLSALVNTPINWGNTTQQVYIDNSGNSSNDVNWLTSTSSLPAASTGRMAYER